MRPLACWVTPLYSADVSAGGAAVNALGQAFDAWLERKLHEMFDSTVLEPLPPDLLSLVDQLGKEENPASEK